MHNLIGVLFDGVAYGSLLFLISVGLSVTMGLMNFINLAHGAFAMLGGFVCVTLLSRMGLVRRMDLAEAAYYEPAHAGGEHHHHVVCDRCGKVSQFEDQALETAIDRLARRLKYSVAEHDVVLRGACPDCRNA